MAWAVIQSASNENDGTTVSQAFTTANLSSGSKIIVAVGHNGPAGIPTVKDGANNAWTHVAQGMTGTNRGVDLYALDVPAGDVGTKPTITATVSSGAGLGICIMEVSGLLSGNTSAMWDGTPGTLSGTSGSTGSPTYSSTAASEFLVSAYGDTGDGNTVVKNASWTMVGQNGSTSANALIQYKDSTNGAETDGFTSADTGGWGIVMVAFNLPGGGSPVSVTGAASTMTLTAPAGTVNVAGGATGLVSQLALAAPAGSVSAAGGVTGLVSGLTLAAPAGSVSTGAAGVTGPVSQLALAAPAGTAGAAGGATGAVSLLALAAPAGTVNVAGGATGTPATLSLAAPAGSLSVAASVTGLVSGLTLNAPAGSVSTGSGATGIPAALALAAPAGSLSVAASVTGAVAGLTLTAPAGAVSSSSGIPGIPAGLTLAAPVGSVSAGATVQGVTAQIALGAPPGNASVPGASSLSAFLVFFP